MQCLLRGASGMVLLFTCITHRAKATLQIHNNFMASQSLIMGGVTDLMCAAMQASSSLELC